MIRFFLTGDQAHNIRHPHEFIIKIIHFYLLFLDKNSKAWYILRNR